MISDEIAPGVHLHIHETQKFKTQILTVTFLWPMDRSIRAESFLLSYLLSDTTLKYPRKQDLLCRLDHLYGAGLTVINVPRGACDRLKFTITGVHVPYLRDSVMAELFDVLKECIFFPRIIDGVFPDAMFRECREQASLAVRIVNDDPQTRCAAAAAGYYGGSPAMRLLPQEAEIRAATPQSCADAWKWIKEHARIDIQVMSHLPVSQTLELCRSSFPFSARTEHAVLNCFVPGKQGRIEQEKNIPQSHIVMLLESGILYGDENYYPYVLGNGIFGGLPASLLFQNVRESQGLCYSVESGVQRYDGVLRVSTAVEADHIEEAIDSIMTQLDVMKRGAFSDEDLLIARHMYVNVYRSAQDDPDSLLASELRRALIPDSPDMTEVIRLFSKMDRASVVAAFEPIRLRTVSIVRQVR